MVAMEMERFRRNMAMMAAGSGAGSGKVTEGEEQGAGGRKGGSAERWAAIRGFISQTLEKREDTNVQMGQR